MKEEDREKILQIIQSIDMFRPDEILVAEEMIDIYLHRPQQKDYYFVVAENEKQEVVGYLSYGPTPLTAGTYDLYWMAISPQHQGQGHGKELVHWLENKVRNEQGRMVVIETSSQPRYHSTRQFYLGLGYQEVARVADFYKPGDDRIIYVKHLA